MAGIRNKLHFVLTIVIFTFQSCLYFQSLQQSYRSRFHSGSRIVFCNKGNFCFVRPEFWCFHDFWVYLLILHRVFTGVIFFLHNFAKWLSRPRWLQFLTMAMRICFLFGDQFFSQFLRWPLSSQLKLFPIRCCCCVCAAKMVVLLDFVYASRNFRWNTLLVFCTISMFTAMLLSAFSGSIVLRNNSHWMSSSNKFVINRSPILSSFRTLFNVAIPPNIFQGTVELFDSFNSFPYSGEEKEGLASSKCDVARSDESNFWQFAEFDCWQIVDIMRKFLCY